MVLNEKKTQSLYIEVCEKNKEFELQKDLV